MPAATSVCLPAGYRETYRGHVPAWETDDVEHFTVAYYFERLERVAARLLIELGADPARLDSAIHQEFFVRYARELRVASVFTIQTVVIKAQGSRWHLGHRIIDVLDGAVCTTIEHHLEGALLDNLNVPAPGVWDGPDRDSRSAVGDGPHWYRTSTDVVMPSDVDSAGSYRLSSYIHRFSSSGGQLMTQFGWTPDYEDENRIGFSTFEFQFTVNAPPRLGDIIDVEACLAHIGRSSVHVVHRIIDAPSGKTAAVLHQLGVHLDKDARRPSAIPEHIREAASAALANS